MDQQSEPGPPIALCAFLARRIRAGLQDGRIVRGPDGRLLPIESRRLTSVVQWREENSLATLVEETYAPAKVVP